MVAELSEQMGKGKEIYNIFLKLVFYNIQGALTNQVYEDSLKLLLGDKNGFLLNIDKICSNAIKLTLNDDFCMYVFENNRNLFDNDGSQDQREDIIFAKSCFKLNEITYKNNKSKNSAFNSFNCNYNISSNDVLKFEIRDNVLVIHKLKNLFQEDNRNYDTYQLLINNLKECMIKGEPNVENSIQNPFACNNINLHIHNRKKTSLFNKSGTQNISLNYNPNNEQVLQKIKKQNEEIFKQKREALFYKKR